MNSRQILKNLFNELKKHQIPFCVLRNYQNLPEKVSHDVDILVSRKLISDIDNLLTNISERHGAKVWQCRGRDNKQALRLIFWTENDRLVESVLLDFLFKIDEFGVEYIDSKNAIDQRRNYKNFYILDKETEFLHIFIHGMFHTTSVAHRERYKKKLQEFLEEGRKIPKESIRRLFLAPVASSIINFLENGKTKQAFKNRSLKKFLFITRNGLFFKKLCSYMRRKFKKLGGFFRLPGDFLVVLGPDGVGKTTTALFATELLRCIGISSRHFHLGFRPGILPRRQKLGLGEPNNKILLNSGNKKPSRKSSFRGILQYCYHFVDYILAYYFRIRPFLVRGGVVIAERYFYDYVLYMSRKNMNVSERLVWWTFKFFIPKPSACVLLTNDPKEIRKRREELSEKEISELLKKSEALGRSVRRFITLKTDKPPEVVAMKLAEWLVCDDNNLYDRL